MSNIGYAGQAECGEKIANTPDIEREVNKLRDMEKQITDMRDRLGIFSDHLLGGGSPVNAETSSPRAVKDGAIGALQDARISLADSLDVLQSEILRLTDSNVA